MYLKGWTHDSPEQRHKIQLIAYFKNEHGRLMFEENLNTIPTLTNKNP